MVVHACTAALLDLRLPEAVVRVGHAGAAPAARCRLRSHRPPPPLRRRRQLFTACQGGLVQGLEPCFASDPFDEALIGEAALWESQGRGFMRTDFDPATQQRKRLTVNSALASGVIGIHREEVMARFGRHDMPTLTTEEDAIRLLVFELANIYRDELHSYVRFVNFSGACLLVCRTSRRSFDFFGRICTVRTLVRVITTDEYDEALRLDPAACPLALTGDTRGGRHLLADAQEDFRRSLPAVCASAAGRARLDTLASRTEELLGLKDR